MYSRPVIEAAQRVSILQNQIIGYGQDLAVTFGKACLQILSHAGSFSNVVKKIRGPVKTAFGPVNRHWPRFVVLTCLLQLSFARGNNLLCLRIHLPDKKRICLHYFKWLPPFHRYTCSGTQVNIGHIHFQKKEIFHAVQAWVMVYRLAKSMDLAQALDALKNLAEQLKIPDGLEGWEELSKQMERKGD